MIHLVAYQRLYGPITPHRLDVLLARQSMDLVGVHLKRGATTRLKDHLMEWRPRVMSGRDMLDTVRGLQATYEARESSRQRPRKRRRK